MGSTRFHGKPLAMINGKTMIQRVYDQARKAKSLTDIVIATDHADIVFAIHEFDGEVTVTRNDHPTGTDRCFEALHHQVKEYDYIINIQGDQPYIQPEQIDLLATLCDGETEIGTLVKRLEIKSDIYNPNIVKAAVRGQHIVRFCRSGCRYPFKHIGIYAYRADILRKIYTLQQSPNELKYDLEQFRWLDNGLKIKCLETNIDSISVDTPEDILKLPKE